MTLEWIEPSHSLPEVGAPIEFLLENRAHAMHGIFAFGAFRSRWGTYATYLVTAWRATASGEGDNLSETGLPDSLDLDEKETIGSAKAA